MPPFALKVIRSVFSVTGALSPRLASRMAFELFCLTPSRRPAGNKARRVHAEGRLRLAGAEALPFRSGRARVMAYRFNGRGRVEGRQRVLVVHGWGSSAAYISAMAEGLAAEGLEVVVLDFPGHGRSSGRRLNMRVAVEAIVAADRRFGPFDAAVGHSFGGASLMLAAGGIMSGAGRISPRRIAVIGSPTSIEWLFEGFSRHVGLNDRVQQGLVGRAEAVAGATLPQFDAVAVARRIGTPLLVVHAEEDKEVSADHARRYAMVPNATIYWANGHGHRRIISAPDVIETVRTFIAGDQSGSQSSAA